MGKWKLLCKKMLQPAHWISAVHPAIKWIWKSNCQAKHKVFYWLLLHDRLNTRALLRKKNMALDSYTYELCILQKEEKLRHLFYRCSFVERCWLQIGVSVPTWLRPQRTTRYLKRRLRVPFAMEIIILISWSIWTERKKWIFNNEDPSIQQCMNTFKKEFTLLRHRVKEDQVPTMQSWLLFGLFIVFVLSCVNRLFLY
jgi:hypothetical protein